MQKRPSVSPKNTKQEIWEAYQSLLADMTEESPTPASIKKLETANATLKQQLSTTISELTQMLQNKLAEVAGQFDQATKVLDQLHQLHTAQTQELAREKEEVLTAIRREEENARYEFEKLKKRQTEELAEQKQKFEADLAAKKTELQAQENELKELRQRVSIFDTDVEKAVKEAVTKTTTELNREFNHQKALDDQQASATQNLLQQKIDTLQTMVKNYQTEIERLNSSLRQTNEQFTRIAERAVEKSPSPSSGNTK